MLMCSACPRNVKNKSETHFYKSLFHGVIVINNIMNNYNYILYLFST